MSDSSMQVLVAGGTGVVGRPAVRAMVADGHAVGVAVRSKAAAERARSDGGDPVHLDVFDRDGVLRAAAGCDAVVNLATAIPPSNRAWRRSAWTPNDRLRIEASANLAEAASVHGARFVQESFALALPSRPGEVIGEDTALDPPPRAASTVDAEANAAGVTASGGTGVVLRFAWFAGRSSPQAEELLAWARRFGVAFLPGDPGARFATVDAEDAGRAAAAALHAPAGTYHVVDDEPLARWQHRDALSRLLGRSLRLPPRIAASGPVEVLARDQWLVNTSLREATGWSPRVPSAREGWIAMLAAAASA